MAPVNVFVAATGNEFMRELAGWLVEAAALTGRAAHLVDDRLPEADGRLNLVVAPHEFFSLYPAGRRELVRAAAASVCVGTEQPGTPWFEMSLDAFRRGPAALDINAAAAAELRAAGIDASHLQLGAVPSLTAARPDAARTVDVAFLGALDRRREEVLADLAPRLHHRRVALHLFHPDRPIRATTPGIVVGADKYRLLADSTVLLNVHRERAPARGAVPRPAYFEWMRMVEAMANGCVVVTEPSAAHEPLEAGVHFVEATVDSFADALERLLADDDRRQAIAHAAEEVVTRDLALDRTLHQVLERLEAEVLPALTTHVRSRRATRGRWRVAQPAPARHLFPVFQPFLPLQREAKRLARADDAALAELDSLRCLLRHGAGQHLMFERTPAHDRAIPEVSVVVPLYDAATLVRETLDSVLASTGVAFEVIVVEDHATDASRDVATTYLREHPTVPMLLVAKEANEGLVAARNTGFEHARSPFVMVLDADNLVYPRCLRRLADALHDDRDAAAAYSILEDFGEHRGLRSATAWDVERLCTANYIDAQAMIRRSAWEALGGYRPDDTDVYGWEDWDLWLRIARAGGHAVLVPEILGRYRVRPTSMVSLSNVAADDARAAIRARYPDLPWPPSPL
jgi:hypothetical protein